jgi:hypothetical protein
MSLELECNLNRVGSLHVITPWLRLRVTSNCFPHPHYTYTTCFSTLICCPVAYSSSLTVLPILLGSDFEVLGHLWSQHDVIMSWLRLVATSNCFPHPYYTYTKYLSTLICCALAYSNILTQLYPSYLAHILRFCVSCGVKMM